MPSRKASKKSRKLRKLRKTRGRGRRRTQRGGDEGEKCDKTYVDQLCNKINADETPIKDATTLYRKGALKCHPDKNPGDKAAEEAFKDLGNCFEKKKKSLEVPQPANAAPSPAPAQQPGSVPSSGPRPTLQKSPYNAYYNVELPIPADLWKKIWDPIARQVKQPIRDRLKEMFGTSYDDYRVGSLYTDSFKLKSGGEVKVHPGIRDESKPPEGKVYIMVETRSPRTEIFNKYSAEVREMYDQLTTASQEETS